MTTEQLRKQITTVPFFPFRLLKGDGRVSVLNRDFILIPPPYTHTFVFQPDGAYEVLDISLLLGVEYGPPKSEPQPKPSDFNA